MHTHIRTHTYTHRCSHVTFSFWPSPLMWLGLARFIYIRCTYGVFGREITKYTVYIYVYIYTVLANPTYDCFPVTFLTQGCWPTPEVLCSRSYMPLPPGTRGGCAACSLFLFTSDVSLLQSEGLTHSAFCSVGKFQLGSFPGATCQTCVSLGCVIQRVGQNRIYTPHITWFSCQYTVHSTCIYIYGHRIWSPYMVTVYIYIWFWPCVLWWCNMQWNVA
jgi:hypothetical protein